MDNYEEYLEKVHAEKEKLMKTATGNLMKAAFAKYDEKKALVEASESDPNMQIEFITVLNGVDKDLSAAVSNFNQGNFESAVSDLRRAMKNLDGITPHKVVVVATEGYTYSPAEVNRAPAHSRGKRRR